MVNKDKSKRFFHNIVEKTYIKNYLLLNQSRGVKRSPQKVLKNYIGAYQGWHYSIPSVIFYFFSLSPPSQPAARVSENLRRSPRLKTWTISELKSNYKEPLVQLIFTFSGLSLALNCHTTNPVLLPLGFLGRDKSMHQNTGRQQCFPNMAVCRPP